MTQVLIITLSPSNWKKKQKFCGVVEKKKYLSAAEMKNNSEDKPLSSKHEETNEFLL